VVTRSGWAWWLLAAVIAFWAAWMQRYEPVILREEDTLGRTQEVRWVWDRWRARWCTFGFCVNLDGKPAGELMQDNTAPRQPDQPER
jgi:hypothetical protein